MSQDCPPLWRDPLFSPGDRFPLGPPHGVLDDCQEGPSGPATRPFSLRHVVASARTDTPPTWRYTYCPQRQIALVHDVDGSLIPLLKHTKPGATPAPTSGFSDSDPNNPSPEEVGLPDYQQTTACPGQSGGTRRPRRASRHPR
ncbi:MAG TPA: putative ATP-grasp-modified RiPP [Mycobacteriales bacterium]|nr:putative ATP-grasp-modified RiPP [Mycobacteriales bacterium]